MIEVSKKFSRTIIKTMFATIIFFIGAVMAFNALDKQVQTELIIGFFGIFGGEFGLLAWIKTKKTTLSQDQGRQEQNNQTQDDAY